MLRIVAGQFGGRRIQAPAGRRTRPTAEKVRAALFNALHQWLSLGGARVLDLYAGSGALGIEALSRGAAQVTFVESDPRSAALVRANLKSLGVPAGQATVVRGKALPWLRQATAALDMQLVLLDPPYAAGEYESVLQALAQWRGLAPEGIIAVEAPARQDVAAPPGLAVLRTKRYGDTQLVYLGKAAREAASAP
ncbi:MAG: 16S rRNA (guanine(966)-N(2))-methyltransferase RsmD [SAR324 cluster bacterium]